MDIKHAKKLKSFVLRQGRMTAAQKYALEHLWSLYGIGSRLGEPKTEIHFHSLFAVEQPLMLEIGFGMGDSLVHMAAANPDQNYLGIEVHTPGIGHILKNIDQQRLTNLKIFHADAIEVLEQAIPENSLQAVYLFFPDPWQKKRHHKRRLVNNYFIELIYSRLKNGGLFHMATDWQDYADHMLDAMQSSIVLSQQNEAKIPLHFINLSAHDNYIERPSWRPKTKFERKGLQKGHEIRDILYQKINHKEDLCPL